MEIKKIKEGMKEKNKEMYTGCILFHPLAQFSTDF